MALRPEGSACCSQADRLMQPCNAHPWSSSGRSAAALETVALGSSATCCSSHAWISLMPVRMISCGGLRLAPSALAGQAPLSPGPASVQRDSLCCCHAIGHIHQAPLGCPANVWWQGL